MMAARKVLVLLLVLLSLAPARGQTHSLRHLGVQEGVGHVRSLSFDRDGFLWLATPRGLLRYDGVRFEPFLHAPASQVASAPDGTLWVWAGTELLRRKPDAGFVPVPVPEAMAAVLERKQHGHLQLYPTRDGRLALVDLSSGLWLLDPGSGRWTSLVAAADGERVQSFAEGEGGEAWVLTTNRLGWLRLPRGEQPAAMTWLPPTFSTGRHVRPHPQGAWVMADRGLFIYGYDGSTREVLDETYRSWFTLPAVAPDGTLALAVEHQGIALHIVDPDGSVRRRLSVENGLRTPTLDAVRFDDEGGLWLASEHGLDHLEDPDRLVAFPLREGGVTNLRVEPRTGALWAGTYGGLLRFTGAGFERIGPPRAATPPDFDEDGAAHWIAFGDRPFRRWAYQSSGGIAEEVELTRHYRATLPDGRRLLGRWLGPRGTEGVSTAFEDGRVLSEGAALTAFAVGPLPRRRVWLAFGERLDTIEGDVLGSRSAATSPSVHAVLARLDGLGVRRMELDRFGRIWLATVRGLGVLYETAPDEWNVRIIGPADGLPTETVNNLDVAEGERLWLGTDRGVFGFTLHAEEPWLRPLPLAGLNAALPTEVALDLREDGDGALWIAPVGAGAIYRYDWRTEALPSPAVRLTGLDVNDRPLTMPAGALRLRADTTRLALALAPLTLRRLSEVRYQYRLVGLDTAWVSLEGEPTARFAYLGPGRYTFEARAVRAGQRPGPVLTVPLHLVPPFYRAGWFFALCGVALVMALAAGAGRHARRAERRAAELEAVVAERTAALEAEKRTTEAQADRLRTLDEAKSRFFANVSHELRTPLTLILGPLRDAAAGRSGDDWARQLPLMRRSGERLLGLVDHLLDLTRLDAGRLRLYVAEADLVALTRRIALAFASRAERDGLALGFETDLGRLPAWVDAERYEQVLSNLLTNAFKFTREGGRVRVSLSEEDGAAVLAVRDTGEGIAPGVLPHVFDRFRQGDDAATRRHEGAGIGLALVRELVELHGGTVEAESAVGFGSLFTVRLPLGRDHFDQDAFAEAPAPAFAPTEFEEGEDGSPVPELTVTRADATVLVVEDHADMRAYLRGLLAPHYAVEEAADGRAGLEAARRLAAAGEPPDLVLSDVMMPGLDGYALCRALKADDALGHVPVVLLTARADEGSRLEGLSEGADDYLAKPFSADELLARCENLVEVRRRLRARFSGEVVVRPTDVVVPVEEADWLEEVKAVCEAHLADAGFGVDWLASEVGLSARQLRRRLKAASGLTPGAFLRTMRLERAAQLLDGGGGSIGEVASAVGYTDAESFSRAFRQGFGLPPSAYAEAAGEDVGRPS